MRRAALACALALAGALAAAEPSAPARALANEVQPLLTPERARDALAKLTAYRGADEALVERLRGDASFLAADHAGAVAAYRRALALPDAPAGTRLNLARALAAAGDARAATTEFAAALGGGRGDGVEAGDLAAWIRALLACDERRAAALAAGEARLRFPDDAALARLELLALEATAAWDDLAAAASGLLARGADPEAWRALVTARAARATDDAGRDELAATALAAHRAQAIDAATAARAVRAAGLTAAAATLWREALAVGASGETRLTAAECFADAGDAAGARDAVAALASDERATARARRLAARVALALGDAAAARSELDALVAAGEADGAALLWSARLAQDADDAATAIDRYQRAALDPATARTARLGLALALARAGRRDEAEAAARTALADDPSDRQARAVLEWILAR